MIKVVSNKEQTATGPLPIVFNSDGTPLDDYKLYGTSEGSGAETEGGEPEGYKLPMTVTSEEETDNDFPFAEAGTFDFGNGTVVSDGAGRFTVVTSPNSSLTNSALIPLAKQYTIPSSKGHGGDYIFYIGNPNIRTGLSIVFYDSNGNKIENWLCNSVWRTAPNYLNMAGSTIAYIGFNVNANTNVDETVITPMFSKNDNLTSYIPYRYSATIPIYIGDTKLDAEEYVDYEEQKIYKRTENDFPYGKAGEYEFGAAAKIISDGKGNYIMNGRVTANLASSTIPLDRAFEFPESGFFYLGNSISARNMRIAFYDENNNYLGFYSIDGAWRIISNLPTLPPIFAIGFGTNTSANYPLNDYTVSPMFSETGELTQYIPYYNSTDPPVTLPELSTYSGENTLSCSEALGDECQVTYVGPVEETITKIMRTEDDGLGNVTEHVLYKEGS